jgi:hypothetical protein
MDQIATHLILTQYSALDEEDLQKELDGSHFGFEEMSSDQNTLIISIQIIGREFCLWHSLKRTQCSLTYSQSP